jgi:photosystem II stability/assembly factor-like uncharacterized protein
MWVKKGSGWNEFKRWKSENEGKYYPDGNRSNVDHYIAAKAYQEFTKNAVSRSANPPRIDLGPYRADNITSGYNPGIGRIECFEVNRQNQNELYMGSRSGGFWKTMDGGKTWKNTADYLVASGVNTMDTDPLNFNEVLINVRNAGNGYTHGVYRSTDGGNTWYETIFNSKIGFGGLGKNLVVYSVRFHPLVKNVIFIATNIGLYRSSDNLMTYTLLLSGANITDIEFHPTDPNYIYLVQTNTPVKSTLTISNDMGITFKASGILPNYYGVNNINGFLDVTPAKPNNVYFASGNGNSVYKSNDRGASFVKVGNMSSNSVGYFAISDIDTLNMISGYLNLEGSNDGGVNFTQINEWNKTIPNTKYTHADLRVAQCINGVFYIGTDGYFCRSSDFGNSWVRLNNGTGVREFYRIGISQSDKNVLMAGSQDNGTSILNEFGWLEWNGADGMEAIIHPLNRNIMVGSWQYGTRHLTLDGGESLIYSYNPEGDNNYADWLAPLVIDPADHMKIYHFSDKMFVSNQFGNPFTWSLVGSPKTFSLQHAAIAENNSNLIVVSTYSYLLLSIDKGLTWNANNSGLPSYNIADVCFDPKFDSTLVVCFDRYEEDNQKIFISHNLGKTWTNITYNIGNMPIRSLAIDHTPERNIYVGGEIGVYTKSMNSRNWELYNSNLPNVTVRDFEIHYGSNTLKAATWGRGLWEVQLKNRESYPKINKIIPSDIVGPNYNIPVDSQMNIAAIINYDKTLSEVYLLWSYDNKTLHNKIAMTLNQNQWHTVSAIPSSLGKEVVYFKVVAIGSNQDTSETYTFMYRQKDPCDPITESKKIRTCKYFVIEKDTIFRSGSYERIYKDIYLCDSIIQYNVIIDTKPNNTLSISNTELISNEANATSYQWLDCENQYTPLVGQTKRNLSIEKSGIYAVELKKFSCIDTSACAPLLISGTVESNFDLEISLIPNPNQGDFIVISSSKLKDAVLDIYQLDGKKLFSKKINEKGQNIKVQLVPGIYIAVFRSKLIEVHKKLYITQ